jgi:hypothetical protein
MPFTQEKLRAMLNLLADEKQAHAVAYLLSKAAAEDKELVADFIAKNLGPANGNAKDRGRQQEANADCDDEKFDPSDGHYYLAKVCHTTALARLVSMNGYDKLWLPKSQCKLLGYKGGKYYRMWIKDWIAREKGILEWAE